LEDLLLKDLFLNSLELKEQNLNISVADLIYVYNNLIEKQDLILVDGFVNKNPKSKDNESEDPLNNS
jgi:hypothetical protein